MSVAVIVFRFPQHSCETAGPRDYCSHDYGLTTSSSRESSDLARALPQPDSLRGTINDLSTSVQLQLIGHATRHDTPIPILDKNTQPTVPYRRGGALICAPTNSNSLMTWGWLVQEQSSFTKPLRTPNNENEQVAADKHGHHHDDDEDFWDNISLFIYLLVIPLKRPKILTRQTH